MRFSIRWKLILSISIPLLLTYGGMFAWDYWRLREAAIEEMQDRVQERAQNLAGNLNARLEAIMQVAGSTAMALARQNDLSDEQLRAVLTASLRQNQWVSSTVVILDPPSSERTATNSTIMLIRRGAGPGGGGGFAGPAGPGGPAGFGGGRFNDAPGDQAYRQMPLYTEVAAQKTPTWIHPYTARGLGPGPVCTYSVPVLSGERFRGVVAVNVAVIDLQQMRPRQPQRGRRGPPTAPTTLPSEVAATMGADAVGIIGPDGRTISGADPRATERPSIFEWAERNGAIEFAQRLRAALAGEGAVLRVPNMGDLVPGFKLGETYWIAMAPITATGWVFIAAIPESQVIAPVLQRLGHRAIFLTSGLLVLVAVATIVSIRLSRPIEKMAVAVNQLAAGDLDAQVKEVHTHDELGQLAGAFNSMTRQLKQHVAALTEQTAAREKVESEMRIARQIQTDLLPRTFPPFPDRKEFELHAVNVPARRVAGDFYDFFFVDQDLLTVVVGDVSGKGMPAALLMAVTRTIVRNLAMEGLSPGKIVERANTLLLSDTSNGMFVTLFLLQYDPMRGSIRYVNAGHPRPYRLEGRGGAAPFGEITGALLGVCTSNEVGPFLEAEDQLQAGETLLIFTDGLTEARSPDGKMLRDSGALALAGQHARSGVRELCERLVVELDRFQGSQPSDDVTLLALRRC